MGRWFYHYGQGTGGGTAQLLCHAMGWEATQAVVCHHSIQNGFLLSRRRVKQLAVKSLFPTAEQTSRSKVNQNA